MGKASDCRGGASGAAIIPYIVLQLVAAVVLVLRSIRAEAADLDAVTAHCYASLLADASCCKDQRLGTGVQGADVFRPEAAWECIAPPRGQCLDSRTGARGKDRLWWPTGADCSSPRILYIHGGNWTHYGPMQSSYDVLASKLAEVTSAVVLVPDFRLVPVGNYSDSLHSSTDSWKWLAQHGPGGLDCSSAPPVPQFVGGDSSGGATALSLVMELQRSQYVPMRGFMPPVAGFFGFSPWTNLACDTPTYCSEAFASVPDTARTTDFIGDILYREAPRRKSRAFRSLAVGYAGSASLLEDPVVSPFHAEDEHLSGLPPMYFAVSGTESMAGDSVVFATKAAQLNVPVALDIFNGMWHVFPQYSEGCGAGKEWRVFPQYSEGTGAGKELWQGVLALMHTGDFVRQIFAAAKNQPGQRFVGPGSLSPQTEMYYVHPAGSGPWVRVQPLTLAMEAAASAGLPASSATPGILASGSRPGGTAPAAPSRGLEEDRDGAPQCDQTVVSGAYFTGAVGGGILMVLGLAGAWVYASTKHGLCLRIRESGLNAHELRTQPGSLGEEQGISEVLLTPEESRGLRSE